MKQVLETLEKMNIKYEIINHPPATTTLEADKYVEGHEGVLSKTLFLAGKKDRTFYLLILDENKRVDLKKLSNLVNERLHFADEKYLQAKLNLKPGSVSLFGLLNNEEKDVKVYIDKDIINIDKISFHPNENIATVFIKMSDMFKFLNELNYNYQIIEL